MLVLLGLHFGIWQHAMSHAAHTYAATATRAQENHDGSHLCGWMGVRVSPMTAAFAESLGMAQPYGAIFDQPEAGSPAAAAGIEQGDVLTAINAAAVGLRRTHLTRRSLSDTGRARIGSPARNRSRSSASSRAEA